MSEARGRIKDALEDKLTPNQLTALVDEVLAITKQGRGWCPSCNKAVLVQVADSKAVVTAISELLTQAEGRPKQQEAGEGDALTVVYQVILDGGEPDVQEAA